MPSAPPLPSPPEMSEQEMAKRRSTLRILYAVITLHLSSFILGVDSKMLIYLRAFKGDTARYASIQSQGMAMMMGSSLVLAPLFTAYAEAKGRRPLFLLGTLWSIAMRFTDLAFPVPRVIFATSALGAVASATMQGTQTSIGDLFPGDPKAAGAAIATAQVGAIFATIMGPMVSTRLAARDVRLPLAVSVALTSLELCLLQMVPETLPLSQRVPLSEVTWKKTNPFAFLQIFAHGPRLAAFALVQLLTFCTEPRLYSRTAALVHGESLSWSVVQRGNYLSVSSAAQIPGFAVAGRVTAALGSVSSLALGTSVQMCHGFLEYSWVAEAWQQYSLLPGVTLRGIQTASLNALLLQAGQDAGMRQGELRGCLISVQNLAGVICSPLWAWWYGVCVREKRPRRFFIGIVAAAGLQLLGGQLANALPSPAKEPPLDGLKSQERG